MAMRVDERPQTVQDFLAALRPRHAAETPRREHTRPDPPRSPSRPSPSPLPQTPRAQALDVDVQGPRLGWPDRGACSLEAPEGELRIKHTGSDVPLFLFQETRGWDVPYCARCLRHVGADRAAQTSGSGGCAPVGTGLAATLAAGTYLGSLLEGTLLGLLVWLAARALSGFQTRRQRGAVRALLKPSCVAAGPAAGYNGWFGDLHSFTFLNHDYAEDFRRANAAQLVR
jgi:hypothetical protein